MAAAANEDVESILTAAEGTTENDVILVASNPREAELWDLCDSFTGACELMPAGARTSDDAYAECVTLLRAISSVEDLKIVEGRLPSSANVWGKSLFFNRLTTSATEQRPPRDRRFELCRCRGHGKRNYSQYGTRFVHC